MNRRILITLLLAVFIAFLGMGIIAPLMPIYATELGATGVAIGMMIAGYSCSRLVLQPIVGNLSDSRGRKRFLVGGLFLYALVGFTYTLATSVEHLVVIRIFHGVGSAMIMPVVMAYVADLTPVGQEGKSMGRLNSAIFWGIGGGPIIGGLFRDTLGMDSAFYTMTALTAVALALVLVFLPPEHADRQRLPSKRLLSTIWEMMHNRRVVGMLLPRIASMIIIVPTFGFLPILMDDSMDATGLEIGIVIAARTIPTAALQSRFGRLVDQHKKVPLLLIGSFVAGVAILVVPFTNNSYQLIPLFVIVGTGEALVWPVLGAMAVEEGHRYGQGSMMGVFSMAMSVGVVLGAIASGVLMDRIGLIYVFFLISALLFISAVVGGILIGNQPAMQSSDNRTGIT
ncbi:MAG: MFS transporter [Chloroflexota bacterium]|nr:MFS transporter [Chloroflexota bacterium]